MKRSLLLFALCACAFGAQAEVYKWIDENGKVQYGDAPPKNAKAKVVSGGVTVVPATVIPTPTPAPKTKPEGEAAAAPKPSTPEAKRDDGAAPAAAPASAQSDAAAAAREAALRARAIERCKASRGVDCDNEVDAQLYGRPAPAPVVVPIPGELQPGAIPGWSQPPIRPNRPDRPAERHEDKRPPAKEREPVMPMKRLGAQSSSAAGIKPVR